jgi:glucokinase
LVLDGKPFTGAHGATGTMASSPLPRAMQGTNDGPSPTLEEIAAGPALVTRYNQQGPGGANSAEEVFAAAEAGETVAVALLQRAGEALGAGVGWLINVLDPEAVIMGGGLGLGGGTYWESFVKSARRHIWSKLHCDLPILPAAQGRDAGIIGAAATAWKKVLAEA